MLSKRVAKALEGEKIYLQDQDMMLFSLYILPRL